MKRALPKRLNPFECRVLDTVRRRQLIERGDRVLIAYSGGPDSSALLRAMAALRPEMDLTLEALHVDHGLHAEAQAQAQHCRYVAEELEVPLAVCAVNVAKRSEAGGLSLEHAAREVRYQALQEKAAVTGASLIATGHTADDQAETVLLNLIRGTGHDGLAGIPPRRGIIVRPLIDASRVEILEYLDERGVPSVEDPTNALDDALRNRLRRYLLPEMERIADRPIAKSLARLADAAQAERHGTRAAEAILLEKCRITGDNDWGVALSVAALSALDRGASSLALRGALREVAGEGEAPSLAQINQVLRLLESRSAGGEQKVGTVCSAATEVN